MELTTCGKYTFVAPRCSTRRKWPHGAAPEPISPSHGLSPAQLQFILARGPPSFSSNLNTSPKFRFCPHEHSTVMPDSPADERPARILNVQSALTGEVRCNHSRKGKS